MIRRPPRSTLDRSSAASDVYKRQRYYSPAYSIANARMAGELREKGIGLLVWTVNDMADMCRMLDLEVDGLITDKPREAMALIASRQ